MKYLPTDVSTFSTMMQGNYIYVDKTQQIYNLFSGGHRYYFLSRPRRFGKSLLVSTLHELFLNNRELFADCWIYKSNYNWKEYPVIYLDFSIIAHGSVQELLVNLAWTLDQIGMSYEIDIKEAPSVQAKFSQLITLLSKKHGPNSVVILIDEYDKPMLDHLMHVPLATEMRQTLRGVYDVLKGLDDKLRAVFITGVTKFAKTSIFSGINNLNDISLKPEAATLLGYTQAEIQHYFSDYLNLIIREKNISREALLENLEFWYNGYRFSEENARVYNPFSVLYYLKDKKIRNYWFESGTPTFLIKLLKTQFDALQDIEQVELSPASLATFELDNIPLITLLFQTGYLTILDVNENTGNIRLSYPNEEVKESFTKYLLATLTQSNQPEVEKVVSRMVRALTENQIDLFCNNLQSLFAHIPYNLYIEQERYFHSLMQILGIMLGLEVQSEVITDKGRIDLIITTDKYLYIFELKFNMTTESALQQIEEKRYFERYQLQDKIVVLVGLVFNYKNNRLALECASKKL